MADTEIDDVAARANEAHRLRYSVVTAWLAVALFVLAYVWLVTDVWGGEERCGSAISNPGWSDGSDCWDALYRRSLLGWSALIAGGAVLFRSARYRWGPGWHRLRRSDGEVGT